MGLDWIQLVFTRYRNNHLHILAWNLGHKGFLPSIRQPLLKCSNFCFGSLRGQIIYYRFNIVQLDLYGGPPKLPASILATITAFWSSACASFWEAAWDSMTPQPCTKVSQDDNLSADIFGPKALNSTKSNLVWRWLTKLPGSTFPVCARLRFFALVYPMWISWKVPINYKFLQKDHVVHLPTGGGCCGNESVQVLSVFVADTSLGEGGGMGKVGPFENQNAHFCHVPWARPAQVQLEYSCCQLFVKLGHGVSPGVRDSNVLVVEDVFPHHMESSIQPYIP